MDACMPEYRDLKMRRGKGSGNASKNPRIDITTYKVFRQQYYIVGAGDAYAAARRCRGKNFGFNQMGNLLDDLIKWLI